MTTILIVDDHGFNREMLRTLFTYSGYETFEAENGAEALLLARTLRPGLIITDIVMPVMDGAELARRVRAEAGIANTPMIFYTATFRQDESKALARTIGVQAVLSKPSDPEDILRVVRETLPPEMPHPVVQERVVHGEIHHLRQMSLRLATLLEAEIDLAAERDPGKLASSFVRSAKRIVGSRRSLLYLFAGDGAEHDRIYTAGWDSDPSAEMLHEGTCRQIISTAVAQRRAIRMTSDDPASFLTPALQKLGPFHCYLGAPVGNGEEYIGWLCFIDKDEREEFSDLDARLAVSLAMQFSLLRDSLLALERANREVAIRREAEAELQRRAEEQAFVAELGQLALRRGPLDELFGWVAALKVMLEACLVEILEFGAVGAPGKVRLSAGASLPAGTARAGVAIRGRDASGLGSAWGFLSVHRSGKAFTADEQSFLQNVANVLSVAIQDAAAEEALRESRAQYESILANIPDLTWTAMESGAPTHVSPNATAILGYSPEEFYAGEAAAWMGRIHPDEAGRVAQAFQRLFVNDQPFDEECRFQRKDGAWICMHVRAIRTYGRDGVRYADGLCSDITARKAAEEKLLELRGAMENAVEGISVIDPEGRYAGINSAYASMLGYLPEELIGRSWEITVHPGDLPLLREAYAEMLREGKVTQSARGVRRDGSFFFKEVTMISAYDAAGQFAGHHCFAKDISERQRMEEELATQKRLSDLGRVAATMAHEFNNTLMGIAPGVDLIERSLPSVTDKMQEAFLRIRQSVQRGKRVTGEVLNFTRNPAPALEPLDLAVALRLLEPELRLVAGAACDFTLESPDKGLWIAGEWPRLAQVLTNLVLNARDSIAGTGAVRIAIAVTLRESPHSDIVALTVSDDGPGIPIDVQQRVFDPFFTTKVHGTGMGLSVVRQIITAHGGTINFESGPEEGTVFRIELPRIAAAQPAKSAAPARSPSASRLHILLVEDDENVAAGVSALLDDLDVELATTGHAAECAVEVRSFDAVILDIGLPDASGIDVLHRLRARRPGLPIIMSTGHGAVSEVPDVPHLVFLQKPYDEGTLRNALEAVCG